MPVSRGRALARATLWAAPCAMAAGVTMVVYPNLDVSAVNSVNRLVGYATAIVAFPVPLAALICGCTSLRYLALSVWPGRVCARADARALVLEFGPFGAHRFDAARLDARYPFEQTGVDAEAESFEAYLPQDEQIARLVPWLTHPDATEPIHRLLLRFCAGDEAELAAILRPAVAAWRAAGVTSDGREDRDDVR